MQKESYYYRIRIESGANIKKKGMFLLICSVIFYFFNKMCKIFLEQLTLIYSRGDVHSREEYYDYLIFYLIDILRSQTGSKCAPIIRQ